MQGSGSKDASGGYERWGWGGTSSSEGQTEEKQQTLNALEKFRHFRPYLKKRLKSIVSTGRSREFSELVDDIKYFLDIINDILADEHHGLASINRFIEDVHEMMRTDPDPNKTDFLNDTSVDDDDDDVNQAPSPSPTGPSNPRNTSFEERERNDFENPFPNKDKHHSTKDLWGSSSKDLGFTYTRRSDVDTRGHDIRAPQTEFNSDGRSPFRSNESRPFSETKDSHDNYGPDSDLNNKYRDRKSVPGEGFDRRDQDSDYDPHMHSNRFRGGSSSRGRSGGWNINRSTAQSSAHVNRGRERNENTQGSRGFPDESFDKGPFDYKRNGNFRENEDYSAVHDQDPQDGLEDSTFERRPRPSQSEGSGNKIKDYNRGSSNKDQAAGDWLDLDSDIDHHNYESDTRSSAFPSSSATNINSIPRIPPAGTNVPAPNVDINRSTTFNPNLTNSFQTQAAQMNVMAQQMASNTFDSTPNTVAQFQAMMQGMTQIFQNIAQQQIVNSPLTRPQNVNMNPMMMNNQNAHMRGFPQNPNRFRGSLPNPCAAGNVRFQNRTGSSMLRPDYIARPPSAPNNGPRQSNANLNPSAVSMMNQIRKKAQSHFSRGARPSFGRNNYGSNFNNGPTSNTPRLRNPAPVQSNRPPKLATNQILADASKLDPRLNRTNPPTSQSQQNQSPNNVFNSTKKPTESPAKDLSAVISEIAKKNNDKRLLKTPPPKKVDKVKKVSEFREQMGKEDFIRLGEKPTKTRIGVEGPSTSTASKQSPVVEKSKPSQGPDNSNKATGSRRNSTTDKEKTKSAKNADSRSNKNKSIHNRSATNNYDPLDPFRRFNSKQPTTSSSKTTSAELSKTAKTGATKKFTIPKINKRTALETPPSTSTISRETEEQNNQLDELDDADDEASVYCHSVASGVLETPPAQSSNWEIIEERVNQRTFTPVQKKMKSKKVASLKNNTAPKMKSKKVVQTKKPPVIRKGKPKNVTKKSVPIKKANSSSSLLNVLESDSSESPKWKRGRKRKQRSPSNEPSEYSETECTTARKTNPYQPRRYLTRLQARKFVDPNVQPRIVRTGWENWSKKLALIKKRKNKKYVATYNAAKIKLKLKRKNSGFYSLQRGKKAKLGPNCMVVNSALGKIKIEGDYLPNVNIKSEVTNALECNEDAEMNHLNVPECNEDAEMNHLNVPECNEDAEMNHLNVPECSENAEMNNLNTTECSENAEMNHSNTPECSENAEMNHSNTPECNKNAETNLLTYDPENVNSVYNLFGINPPPGNCSSGDIQCEFDSSEVLSLPEVTEADFKNLDLIVPDFPTGKSKKKPIKPNPNLELKEKIVKVSPPVEPDIPMTSLFSDDNPPALEVEISTTDLDPAETLEGTGTTKNIRSDLFSCRLCPFNGKNIIAHYVNCHRGETIPEVSISLEAFNNLVVQNLSTLPQLFDISYCDSEEETPWPCLYCNEKYKDVRDYWEHLTTHTGEYLYGCKVCDARHPNFATMMNHLKTHKLNEGELVQNLVDVYEPTVSSGGHQLVAYVCYDCRYFQLLAENIALHLEKEGHSPEDAISLKFQAHGPNSDKTEQKKVLDTKSFSGTKEMKIKMEEDLRRKREAEFADENLVDFRQIKTESLEISVGTNQISK